MHQRQNIICLNECFVKKNSNDLCLTGWLFDITGDYAATFLVSGTIGVLGGLLYLSMLLTERIQQTNKDDISNRQCDHIYSDKVV